MIVLQNCPEDSISCIRFAPSSNVLAASSWDSTLYIYTIDSEDCVQTYKSRGAILSCDFLSDTSACSSGLDGDIRLYDLMEMKEFVVGSQEGTVGCLRYCKSKDCIVSTNWNGLVTLWECHSKSLTTPLMQTRLPSNAKAYSFDFLGENYFCVITNLLNVQMYDLRMLEKPLRTEDSNLNYNLRCIRCFPEEEGYAVGCIEGRVSVHFSTELSKELKQYCFKCHRVNDNGVSFTYPVNSVEVHPSIPCLVTGGSDRNIYLWNYRSKKRISQISHLPASVSSLAFNYDGSYLAIACSNLYENGPAERSDNSILIKRIEEKDVSRSFVSKTHIIKFCLLVLFLDKT